MISITENLDKCHLTVEIKKQICSKTNEGYGILPSSLSKINVIEWGLGLGKTTQIKKNIHKHPNTRHVVIAPTRALSRALSERTGCKNYQDIPFIDHPDWKYSDLVTCFPSLHKVQGQIDYLYIDEIEECITELQNPSLFNGNSEHAFRILKHRIQNAKQVFLLDAHAGASTKKLIELLELEKETSWFVCPQEEKTWTDVGSTTKHKNFIIQRAKNTKMAIACQSVDVAKDVEKVLTKLYPKQNIRLFHGDNYHDQQEKYGKDAYICDILIYSPVIGSGISIDIKNHYNEIHIITSPKVGSINQIKQMAGRVRHPVTNTIYFSGNKNNGPDTKLLEEAYHTKKWNTLAKISAQLNQSRQIEYSCDMDYDPQIQEFVHLMATKLMDEYRHGLGWSATFLRVNCNTKLCPSFEMNEDIKEEFKERKKKRPFEEAVEIVKAPNIGNNDFNASHESKQKHRIQQTFGDAFTTASPSEEIEIAKEDRKGNLTKKTVRFADFWLLKNNPQGKDILAHQANKESKTTTVNFREHRLLKATIFMKIINQLNIDFENTDEPIDQRLLQEAFITYKQDIEALKKLNIPIPQEKPIRWLSSLLRHIGLKQKSIKRPKSRAGQSRKRTYCLDLISLKRMENYSKHIIKQLEETYNPAQESKMSTTFCIQNNQKVVDMVSEKSCGPEHIAKELQKIQEQYLKQRQEREPNHDTYVSRSSLFSSFSPPSIEINQDIWSSIFEKRKSQGKEPSMIEMYIQEYCIDQCNLLSFTHLASPRRCPRRYPIILPKESKASFFMKSSETEEIDKMILLSSLPKEYYSAFVPPDGYEFFDWDMKSAHATILASLSNDEVMLKWVAGDAHQSTGDLLFSMITNQKQRRQLGKETNSAMISGCSWKWLSWFSSENGIDLTEDQAKVLHNSWWSRFPNALIFRENHKKMIDEHIDEKKSYRLKMNGRTMFDFDWRILAGKFQLNDWPKDEAKRKIKAEMSAFTALLRAHESMMLDLVVARAQDLGLKVVIPMYDGALFLKVT